MKVVLLAGGFGTRIAEESYLKPKPMIEIGGKPILWHIMKLFSTYGFHEFIICCGYKAYCLKEYFSAYYLHNSDITFDFTKEVGAEVTIHTNQTEPWQVTLVDTGLNTMTGGRIKRIASYVGEEPFLLTYGDGVADIDLGDLTRFHQEHGKLATMTLVQPEGRFGVAELEEDCIKSFREKSDADSGWINGGFMVLSPQIFNYIKDDSTVLEKEPLQRLVDIGQLMAYKHEGFWQCMDTQRDKQKLEQLWEGGKAPWKTWD